MGAGLCLTTEECYLDPKVQVRNPGLGRKDIDDTLKNIWGYKCLMAVGWNQSATIRTVTSMIFAGL